MNHLIPGPSVGSLVKKMIAANPDLTTQEIIQAVRASMRTRQLAKEESAGDYASLEVVDEEKALALIRKKQQAQQ